MFMIPQRLSYWCVAEIAYKSQSEQFSLVLKFFVSIFQYHEKNLQSLVKLLQTFRQT